MRCISTRNAGFAVSFKDAVRLGLAPDGGLFIPEAIPQLPEACFHPGLSFQERSVLVLLEWLKDEFSPEEIAGIVFEALRIDLKLALLPPGFGQSGHILELFHGPTLSFKDFGARTLAAFMKRIPACNGQSIFVATSGDTGSAVADAFSRAGGFNVVLLFPEGGVSPVQELQLTAMRPGVFPFAVKGTFDDCQKLVKTVFQDPELAHVRPGSANSINLGRLLPQMLYYVHATSVLGSNPVDICVPSGNLGNIASAFLAKKSGAAIGKLIAAHNANHPFGDYLQTGVYKNTPTVSTSSNAMDVGNPSNFERLSAWLNPASFAENFLSGWADDNETSQAMTKSAEQGYIADPHTAVGLHVLSIISKLDAPVLLASTAHPAKFPETMLKTGLSPAKHPAIEALRLSGSRRFTCPADYSGFKAELLKRISTEPLTQHKA